MHQLYPDVGLERILERLLSGFGHFNIRLFTNNLTPDLDSIASDFTEATWAGYAVQQPVLADFSIATAGHLSTAIASPVVFTNTSGAPVNTYGYYVTDDSGALIAAARFDSAPEVIVDDGILPVVPILGNFSQYSS